jgi:hypothetical protein
MENDLYSLAISAYQEKLEEISKSKAEKLLQQQKLTSDKLFEFFGVTCDSFDKGKAIITHKVRANYDYEDDRICFEFKCERCGGSHVAASKSDLWQIGKLIRESQDHKCDPRKLELIQLMGNNDPIERIAESLASINRNIS